MMLLSIRMTALKKDVVTTLIAHQGCAQYAANMRWSVVVCPNAWYDDLQYSTQL